MGQTKIKNKQIAGGLDGWIPISATCTYQGADDPTYTMYVSGEAQNFLSVGMKFRCFQMGMKFFIITAIGAYDSGQVLTMLAVRRDMCWQPVPTFNLTL